MPGEEYKSYVMLEGAVFVLLVGAGYASLLYTGGLWPFMAIVQGATAFMFLLPLWMWVDHAEHGSRTARDTAWAIFSATCIGVVLQAGMAALALCLAHYAPGELEPNDARARGAFFYGAIAALAPAAAFWLRLLGHHGFYVGREDGLCDVPKHGDDASYPDFAVVNALLSLGYATLILPRDTWWLTLVCAALWLAPLAGACLQCQPLPGAFWRASGVALLLQAAMTGLALGLDAHGLLPPAGQRSATLHAYSAIATLLPAWGFVTGRLSRAMYLAGLDRGRDEALRT